MKLMSKNGIAKARFQCSLVVSDGVVPLRLTRGRSSADPTNSERPSTFAYKRSNYVSMPLRMSV